MVKFAAAAAFIFLSLASNAIAFSETSYYWRDYTGKILHDAVVAGKDVNGDNTYIGQAYLANRGLIVVQINPGVKHVYAENAGVNQVDQHIKILCGSSENFEWIKSNASNLHLDMINKKPVLGGHQDGGSTLYIGRISHQGGTLIGKIAADVIGSADYWCVDRNNRQLHALSYEVLAYVDRKPVNPY